MGWVGFLNSVICHFVSSWFSYYNKTKFVTLNYNADPWILLPSCSVQWYFGIQPAHWVVCNTSHSSNCWRNVRPTIWIKLLNAVQECQNLDWLVPPERNSPNCGLDFVTYFWIQWLVPISSLTMDCRGKVGILEIPLHFLQGTTLFKGLMF